MSPGQSDSLCQARCGEGPSQRPQLAGGYLGRIPGQGTVAEREGAPQRQPQEAGLTSEDGSAPGVSSLSPRWFALCHSGLCLSFPLGVPLPFHFLALSCPRRPLV